MDANKNNKNLPKHAVIALTSDPSKIPEYLGIKDGDNVELYAENQYGQFYVARKADGTMGKDLVRLVSAEQAAKIEAPLCAMIELASASFRFDRLREVIHNLNRLTTECDSDVTVSEETLAKIREVAQAISAIPETKLFNAKEIADMIHELTINLAKNTGDSTGIIRSAVDTIHRITVDNTTNT